MAKLLDEGGQEAVVGRTSGYWLCDDDFFSTAELTPLQHGKVAFPRDWPNVYTTSKALKSLIGKKGCCAGKKVGVVGAPLPEEIAQAKGQKFQPLQSFSNAERAFKAAGLPIVHGYAIFEHTDLAVSEAFVAERYWWNAMPDGKWVDFTPRPAEWPELLLAEAASVTEKPRSVLKQEEEGLAHHLLQARYGLKAAAPAAARPKAEKPAATASKGTQELLQKIAAGDAAACTALLEEVKAEGESTQLDIFAGGPVLPSLVKMLSDEAKREPALRLVVHLTDAGVGQRNSGLSDAMLDEGMVQPLVKVMAGAAPGLPELAAAVVGNLCHESPENQDRVAKCGVFKPLVDMLSDPDIGPAQEAAYAIWNLTVGHEENSAKCVKCGAVPKLAALLNTDSDIAQENAAGALMHVTMSEEARTAIVTANAIPRLCELLGASFEPEVNSQAAGALLNLASDSAAYAKLIIKAGAVGPLVALVKDGTNLAREYAAGALMNVIRGDMEESERAAAAGAIPALASLLQRPSGHSEALGALANLASSSSERQIAIYKAQVTRKSVALLSDPDVDVRRSAAALVMNLAPHAKIKERIVEAGALKALAQILNDEDDAVRERAAGALANILNDHAANVHAAFQAAPEMIPALVTILKDPTITDDAKRQAAHAIAMLAAEDGPCDAVWSAGAGPPLLELLKAQVAEAALGIMNLSWRWPEVKEDLAKGGAVESLVEMLRSGDTMSKEYAAGALMNMTAGSVAIAEKAVSVVPFLVKLLRSDGVQVTEWASGALANLIRVGVEQQAKAIEAGAAPALAALLGKVTTNGKTLLILALQALAEDQGRAIAEALGGPQEKKHLRDYRDNGGEELEEYVNALVEKLGSGFTL